MIQNYAAVVLVFGAPFAAYLAPCVVPPRWLTWYAGLSIGLVLVACLDTQQRWDNIQGDDREALLWLSLLQTYWLYNGAAAILGLLSRGMFIVLGHRGVRQAWLPIVTGAALVALPLILIAK
jgi:hypothetical protein